MSNDNATSTPVQYLPYERASIKQRWLRFLWLAFFALLIVISGGLWAQEANWLFMLFYPVFLSVVVLNLSAWHAHEYRKLVTSKTTPAEEVILGSRLRSNLAAAMTGDAGRFTANATSGLFVAILEPDGLRLQDEDSSGAFLPRERVLAVQASSPRWNELWWPRLQFRITGGTVSFLVNKPWLRWFLGTARRAEVEAIGQRIAKKWSYPGTGAESTTLTQPGSL